MNLFFELEIVVFRDLLARAKLYKASCRVSGTYASRTPLPFFYSHWIEVNFAVILHLCR